MQEGRKTFEQLRLVGCFLHGYYCVARQYFMSDNSTALLMDAWGFEYKGNIVWEKIRKDGGPDGRGVGFYFRNVTELILFGEGWDMWGEQATADYEPTWNTYSNHTVAHTEA